MVEDACPSFLRKVAPKRPFCLSVLYCTVLILEYCTTNETDRQTDKRAATMGLRASYSQLYYAIASLIPYTTLHYTTLQKDKTRMLSTSLTSFGAVLLLHAAYSCLHYKSLLQELDINLDDVAATTRSLPPSDVYVECALGLLVVFAGQLMGPGAGTWQPCVTTGKTKRRPLAAPAFRTREFDIYQDRSYAIYGRGGDPKTS
jgi:hypothetical protein